MIFFGTSKGLSFVPSNHRNWLTYLEQNDGKKLVMDINLEKARRSLNQNAFYWKYLEIISNETGNNSDDLHRLFKGLFLPKRNIEFKGKPYTMSGSTTDLGKAEFGLYMDRICAECNVPIPDPTLL